ncbi:aconitate hydratase [Microvirga sp. 2TAF3]|uniref:aconitate hydratase n=1 Tax=Microvirga sp. 2TAF3 TaxID=3233014 RepID=UPI003F967EE9
MSAVSGTNGQGTDFFLRRLDGADQGCVEIDLERAAERWPALATLPTTLLTFVEALLRSGRPDREERIDEVIARETDLIFLPHRVLMQDYAGLPALLDVAGLRDALAERGFDPHTLQLARPVDLVVDHSIIATTTGPGADRANLQREYAGNAERFAFLRWAEQAFPNLSIVPPGHGIVHQINLERLGVPIRAEAGWIFPDSLIGTDSHTPMAGGLGTLGWGVGGIEATAVLLGLPVTIAPPRTIGVRLNGRPRAGVLATDVALRLTQFLREHGVVGGLVEFFGPGASWLSVPDRASIANMAPEYGATCALFPFDERCADYLRLTGRAKAAGRLERYLARQPLWRAERTRRFDLELDFDLAEVGRGVAGPSLPHQLRTLAQVPSTIKAAHPSRDELSDGDVVLAAITSCTNTSNPAAIVAAGLLARNAVARGLSVHPRIKTSFSPGSRAVPAYLEALGLLAPLQRLGFWVAGYGCMTCVGNSGELDARVEQAVQAEGLNVAAVLSGNRNFQARIHPLIRSNYLASPPLVVAYALAGTVLRDLDRDPVAEAADGPVFLRDLWPDEAEIAAALVRIGPAGHNSESGPDEAWQALSAASGACFPWETGSSYLRRPIIETAAPSDTVLTGARILLHLGDAVTTDHISPVGRIAPESPAGLWLEAGGIARAEFNTYGARRGNAEVMRRGTFANPQLRNFAVERPGWWARHMPDGDIDTIDAVAARYRASGTPTVIVAGENYGIGSARDWAAKGTSALGVRAVIARSFERIHRTNLALAGVLPLQCEDLPDLTGNVTLDISVAPDAVAPGAILPLEISCGVVRGQATLRCRLDTAFEVECWRAGGMLAAALARPAG